MKADNNFKLHEYQAETSGPAAHRRGDPTANLFAACGIGLCQLGDAAKGQDIIVTVLRAPRAARG